MSFFIFLGLCEYVTKGSSMFLTGYSGYPSRGLASSKLLHMYLALSIEWSESQLSAPCFLSPPAQTVFLAALIISSTYIFSVLYDFLSCHLSHRPCSHLKNATVFFGAGELLVLSKRQWMLQSSACEFSCKDQVWTELWLIQDGSCPAVAWETSVCFRKGEPAAERPGTDVNSFSHIHSTCMLMPVCMFELIGKTDYSGLNERYLQGERIIKYIKASIHQTFQNCKIFHPLSVLWTSSS